MRQMIASGGPCQWCKSTEGPFWDNRLKPLDFGNGFIMEADTTLPVLCDRCERKAAQTKGNGEPRKRRETLS
jgi:hypothetical protein